MNVLKIKMSTIICKWIHNTKNINCDIKNIKWGNQKGLEILYAFEVISLKLSGYNYKMFYVCLILNKNKTLQIKK